MNNYKDTTWLRGKYENGGTVISIAEECRVSKSTISYNMKKFNIRVSAKPTRIVDNNKKCDDCQIMLSLSNFWHKKNSCDGYLHRCKSCEKARRQLTSQQYRKCQHIKNKMRLASKKWARNNPEKRAKINSECRNRKKNNIDFRLNNVMGSTVWQALKRNKKGRPWTKLTGYTVDQLKAHLELQFEDWMNWNNWGVYNKDKRMWHIDHIRPISSFNIVSAECEDFKRCWNINNLRPLCALENSQKGSKITA